MFFFFCKSLSECEYIFGITITVLKISQNNDNRGRHLEFYFHTGIGNWFQCFLVYPGLNLSSGSGSRSGSGFRLFHTPARVSVIQNVPEGLPRALLAIVTHLYEVVVSRTQTLDNST